MIDFDTSISDFVVYYAVISFVFLFHCVIKDYDFPLRNHRSGDKRDKVNF